MVSLAAIPLYAATWDGDPASGNWGTDNWGLSGEWPGEDFRGGMGTKARRV